MKQTIKRNLKILCCSISTFSLVQVVSISVFLYACSSKNNKEKPEQVHLENIGAGQAKTVIPAALPDFQVVTEQGSIVQLAQLKGKKVFVNLWASWCPPCRAELPSIQKLYQSVDTSKVAFVLISLDKSFDVARRFIHFKHLKLPVFYPAEDLPTLFQVKSIPTTFIFDESGVLVQQIEGGENYNQNFYKHILQS